MEAPVKARCPLCYKLADLWADGVIDCRICGIYDVTRDSDGTLKAVEHAGQVA